ncbi:Ctr copper transporter [Cutaneotrichosporon oleaginosum]|uniref:Copper transport protein n=1 Tax=Cutaneotrichosporon oleaginosum TaxID=879819 RepID=A0A0J0XGE0_9TREE|nr:Ctr copper transporter [Cutaneotrichosporon oleaginosum]KLT40133.1 Ctr copper transporter [Cutaneotrichosporon oleaginosum]TXT04771.1 hypothetical protein COLE_07590 [Cutaneotrichosporon oleaginosum]
MNMLWNAQVADTCVVFRSWHVSGWMTMLASCAIIVGISVAYAALLARSRRYERAVASTLAATPMTGYAAVDEQSAAKVGIVRLPSSVRASRAGMYAVSVAIAYFLMLVAMTYNVYLCTAIVVGAFLGHYVYEDEMDIR